ncbi:MAG: CHRD domain-containing protein [Geminicoccaceae bacterium]
MPLSGAQEDPTVITAARGFAVLRIVGATVQYNVRYWDLESDIEQAHIHIGARDTTGGVAAFLCSDLAGPPPGTAPCPPSPGRLVGVIDAADVIGPTVQGVAPGENADLQQAIRSGLAYVNIHTEVSPAGEIRGDTHRHFWPY